jgi:hypothetical protein
MLAGLMACTTVVNVASARLADLPMAASETARAGLPTVSAFADFAPRDLLADSKSSLPASRLIVKEVKTAAPAASDDSAGDGQAVATAATVAPSQTPAAGALVPPTARRIHTDYQKAMQEATESRKMLFIYFHDPRMTAARKAFETETLPKVEIQEKLNGYVYLELPTDATVKIGGQPVTLLKHASFAEMLGRSGLAVVDLAHERADYYGHVVSTFPFTPGKYYRREALAIILDLPPGTLTQRTMIYAVRIHPEAPKSTQGQFHGTLAEEAKSHAYHQASIQVQGHHSWDSRFQRINAKLPNDVLAQEVVAESWPNETLVEACVECVDSWRQSPGHWSAVRSRHPLFGYDIKRGRNGIWYATGIFGRFR